MDKPKLLIIDDDETLCESISDTLELEGYVVETAYTAKDGIKKIEQCFYNIVLQDMRLPDSDGITVLEKIKDISTDTEVIMFTAYAAADSVIKAMDKNAFAYLPKPFELPDLISVLKRAIEKQTLIVENRALFEQIVIEKTEWENTFDSISDFISIHDVDSKIIRCNKALTVKLNIKFEDIIGKQCYEVYHGRNEPLPVCPLQICKETLKPSQLELDCFGGNFLVSCYPRFDSSGVFNGVVHIARDITERKRAEESIRKSEQKFRTLVGNIPGATYRCAYDADFTMEYISNEIENITGYPSSDFLNNKVRTFASIIHLEDSCLVRETINDSLKRKKSFAIEYRILDLHECAHWVLERGQGVFDEKGEILWLDGTIIDITERKQDQEKLKISEEKFRTISTTANDSIIMIDNNAYVSFWNSAAERLFGFTSQETVGKKIDELIIPERIRAAHIKGFNIFRETGQGSVVGNPVELAALKKDGTEFSIELSISAVMIKEKWNAIGIIRDITERKHLEGIMLKRTRIASLSAKIGDALTSVDTLQIVLNHCLEAFVEYLDIAFARIWTLNEDENMLELQASAGMYTHIDGSHSRVPVGSLKIGKIAEEGKPYFTNSVIDDPRISGKDWARREGMIAFAGYPMVVDGQMVGVLAMFARNPLTKDILDTLGSVAAEIALGIRRKIGETVVKQSLEKLRMTVDGVIDALALTVEQRDPYTSSHQERVSKLSCAIAEEMGMSISKIEGIRTAGVLHDIGKMHIPAEILIRPGKLTEDEYSIVRTHSQVGYDILKGIKFPWPVADIVHQHHERMDGSGYPLALNDGEILMEARILCVADVVEAMAAHRPYRPALGMDKALEEIVKGKGVSYDPDVVDTCVKVVKEKGFEFKD